MCAHGYTRSIKFAQICTQKVLTIKCTRLIQRIYHKKAMSIKFSQICTRNLSQKRNNDKIYTNLYTKFIAKKTTINKVDI